LKVLKEDAVELKTGADFPRRNLTKFIIIIGMMLMCCFVFRGLIAFNAQKDKQWYIRVLEFERRTQNNTVRLQALYRKNNARDGKVSHSSFMRAGWRRHRAAHTLSRRNI
jgi:hypothetical protein